jgi:hypothetical protein
MSREPLCVEELLEQLVEAVKELTREVRAHRIPPYQPQTPTTPNPHVRPWTYPTQPTVIY